MKFKLNFSFPKLKQPFDLGDKFLLLGSCFADEMKSPLINSGLKTISNPFGTIFHPLAIAHLLNQSLNDSEEVEILERNGLFFAWEAGGRIFSYSRQGLKNEILSLRKMLKDEIESASCILLTFGTAWGYKHDELNRVVGNCHKVDSTIFSKSLSSHGEMYQMLEKVCERIKFLNPNIQILLTVSPVRHVKDGLVENNRSKARLIELVHQLSEKDSIEYFPAYEIVMDELRDYRFFKSDLVHPSKEAVQYVWEAFENFAFLDSTREIIQKIRGVNQSLAHRSLHELSYDNQVHVKNTLDRKNKLSGQFPSIFWEDV